MKISSDKTESPYILYNENSDSEYLVVCEHGGRRVPTHLHDLGLACSSFNEHHACDLGAAPLALRIAERLDTTAVFGRYSRLVIDLNRSLDSPSLIPQTAGGMRLDVNHALTNEEREERIHDIYEPFHDKIDSLVTNKIKEGVVPFFICIHSFTPTLGEDSRPWHIGLLWLGENDFAANIAQTIAHNTPLVIGLNQPYSLFNHISYTVLTHAVNRMLPSIMLECRQDLLMQPSLMNSIAEHLAHIFRLAALRTSKNLNEVKREHGHQRVIGYLNIDDKTDFLPHTDLSALEKIA